MDELEGARMALRVLYVDDERALVSLANQEFLRLGHSFYGFSDPNLRSRLSVRIRKITTS